jgi:hypothetical protein
MSTLAAFADAVLAPQLPPPAGLVTRGGPVDPLRFAVYRNNVHVALVGALAARFPVARRLVGEAFFTALARLYVGAHKPLSPVLMTYGDGLPEFTAAFQPAAGLPYLPDLMRLEIAWSEAYNAAEAEPLPFAGLAAVPGDSLPALRLRRHPATRLVSSPWPVGAIWQAHQHDIVPPIALSGGETVLVTRPGADVGLLVLPPADARFARALLEGHAIAAAAALAPPADIGPALVGLVSAGAFAGIIEETLP